MKRAIWLALMLAAVLCVSPARAGVIFNDFGAGDAYNCCTGWTVSGISSPVGAELDVANLFTAAISGTVSQIDLALALVSGDGGATVSLWTDNAGLPGSELGAWGVTATPGFGSCCAIVTIPGLGAPNLVAGQSYFMVMVADTTSWDAWNWNSQGVNGLVMYNENGGGWTSEGTTTLGAFDVLSGGVGVPEPATMTLLGAGLLLVLARKRATR